VTTEKAAFLLTAAEAAC